MKKIIAPLLLSTLACAAQAATITVDSTVDDVNQSGICTLRDAVATANAQGSAVGGCATSDTGSNTIEFAQALAGETIGVQTTPGEIEITRDLIIDASSLSNGITLDANLGGSGPGSNRIFHVTGGDSLEITGVTFRNGNADSSYGGAIYVDQSSPSSHTLTLEGCAFENNQADHGGAVYAYYPSTISNSTFKGNSADYGGGAVSTSTAAISNSTFEGNSADYGGAVSASTAAISNSTFEGNSADFEGGAVYAFYGGSTLGIVNISNSTFKGNSAGFGGAVSVYLSATISNSTFEGNSASYYGGAVFVNSYLATISNSTFEGNSVTDGGGKGGGGAVYAQSLDARHLTLLNNTVSSGFGQALYIYSSATLHNSIIIGNDNNDQCAVDPWGSNPFTDSSYNLEGYESSGVWQATATTCGSSIASPPSIGSALSTIIATTLVDNSGPTKTLKLPTGSPAIGAADPTPYASNGTSQMLDDQGNWVDATLDQRGFARSAITLGRDLGAYEDRRTPPPSGSGTPIPALPAPLLLALAVAAGLLGRRHLNRNA